MESAGVTLEQVDTAITWVEVVQNHSIHPFPLITYRFKLAK